MLQCSPVRAASLVALSGMALGLLACTPALAQSSLRDTLWDRPSADARKPQYPAVGRYVAAQGEAFVLDRSSQSALLKFEDGAEVFALHPTPGPRGDVIWQNDVGQPMLRSTRLGGLTLFTLDRPTGTPAAFTAPTKELRPRAMAPAALLRQLASASARASRAARRLLPFEAPQVQRGEEPLYADAAQLAAEGVVQAAETPKGRRVLARLRRVRFTTGAAPSATVTQSTLEIVLVPHKGLAGRPSSRRAEQALVAAR
jgi:hypothetical protein